MSLECVPYDAHMVLLVMLTGVRSICIKNFHYNYVIYKNASLRKIFHTHKLSSSWFKDGIKLAMSDRNNYYDKRKLWNTDEICKNYLELRMRVKMEASIVIRKYQINLSRFVKDNQKQLYNPKCLRLYIH